MSIALICTARLIFDLATKLLRHQGAIRYPIFLIADEEEQEDHIKLVKQVNFYTLVGIADSSCLDRYNREETFKYLRNHDIVEAFVSWNAIKNRLYVCWNFHTAGITLRILPTQGGIRLP